MKNIKTFSFLVAMLCGTGLAGAETLTTTLETMGAEPCEDSSLLCVTIDAPRDHFGNDPSTRLPITFAISPASEPSEGMVLYAIGGPGGSGLASAESYIAAFDEATQSRLDFVFFDQRGVGPDHGLSCPLAQGVFDRSEVTLDNEPALLDIVQTYVADCQAELTRPDILPYVGTHQAIRDVEMFRQAIGAPKVWLYGESYGTQFMQTYATTYPDAALGVILDGVVDLNLSEDGFYRTYVLAAERILNRLFAACGDLAACASDMKGPANSVYDGLIAKLRATPAVVAFPLIDGDMAARTLTAGMVESNAFYALYGPDGRSSFLRALAAASRDDLVPMLRMAYGNLYIDPETEAGFTDPGWFGAAYFAITCADYGDGAAEPDQDARRILDEARALAPDVPRLLRSYYVERLVCAYWPAAGNTARPDPFAGGAYPTLILNADTDPITSVSMAYSVLDNVRNGYSVIMQGGPHVIWGRGLACPDQTVDRLIFDGVRPETQVQLCQQDFLAPYAPLTLTSGAADTDALSLAQAIEAELNASADFADWSYSDVLEFSCDHGGRIKAVPTEEGAALQFTACAFWPDVSLYGDGTLSYAGDAADRLVLDLDVLGPRKGHLNYTSDLAAGTAYVTGTLDGQPVVTPRPMP